MSRASKLSAEYYRREHRAVGRLLAMWGIALLVGFGFTLAGAVIGLHFVPYGLISIGALSAITSVGTIGPMLIRRVYQKGLQAAVAALPPAPSPCRLCRVYHRDWDDIIYKHSLKMYESRMSGYPAMSMFIADLQESIDTAMLMRDMHIQVQGVPPDEQYS